MCVCLCACVRGEGGGRREEEEEEAKPCVRENDLRHDQPASLRHSFTNIEHNILFNTTTLTSTITTSQPYTHINNNPYII